MQYLVRYGVIPEVARSISGDGVTFQRGCEVVVQTHRGLQLGTVLEECPPPSEPSGHGVDDERSIDPENVFEILRPASDMDRSRHAESLAACRSDFDAWKQRIVKWHVDVELIDIEKTLDGEKTILYVLCERGPESTKLAIQATANGMGVVEVQPVTGDGLVSQPSADGCGSCGCQN